MFDYSAVAVEIWHQILLAVIDLPYVLDTLVDRQTDFWRTSERYHDPQTYVDSERQRKLLRLVCRSWRDFADGHRYRWINYRSNSTDSGGPLDTEALEAIRFVAANSTGFEPANVTSKPRRVLLQVASKEDMEVFRMTIDRCSSKVTTLFVSCVDGYEDEIFEYMISRSSKLPMVRCLELPLSRNHPMPLRSVSAAYPNLYSFEIKTRAPYVLEHGDRLLLPELEILSLDISELPAASLRTWDLRSMTHLNTPIGRISEGSQTTLEPVRSFGANLTFLNFYRVYCPLCLPVEFWTWCPRLVEFLVHLSWVYLDAPAPANHPLKYVVHWPHCDTLDNPSIEGSPDRPIVLHSLQFLPPGLELFVVWESWARYVEHLAEREYYTSLGRRFVLEKMNEICVQRSIRVEDQNGVSLREFFDSQGLYEV